MAVLFFDGFSANRPRNEKYWGLSVSENENLAGGAIYGSTTTKRNAAAVNSGAQKLTAFGDPAKQQAVKCFFGAQSATRVIVGFAVSGLQIYPNGTDATGASLTSTAQRPLKLFELHDAANNVVLTLNVEIEATATPNQDELRFRIAGNNAFTLASIGIVVDSADTESATFDTHAQNTFVLRETEDNEDFVYLEFAIDMTDNTESKVLFRFNDQPISVVNENDDFIEEMVLAAPIASVAAIKFYGGITKDLFIDDFYVLNSSGTANTNFLGRETRILSPNLEEADLAEWTVVSEQTPADPTLNVVDNTNYITTTEPNSTSTFKPTMNLTAPLVAAVAVTSYAKKTSLNARYEHVYQSLGQPTSVDGFTVSNTNYDTSYSVFADGEYCLDGTQNNRPRYKKAANNYYIYYSSFVSAWIITADLNDSGNYFYYAWTGSGDPPATPPLSGWTGNGSTTYANPTLTAQSCSIAQPNGDVQSLGNPKIVANLSYNCNPGSLCAVPHTTIVEQNPDTAAAWDIAEINAGSFGVRSLEPPA